MALNHLIVFDFLSVFLLKTKDSRTYPRRNTLNGDRVGGVV